MFKRPYTVAMGVTLALVSSVGGAVEPRKAEVRFSVEPQPLRMALNEWAEQAGMSVVLPAGEAAGSGLSPRVEGMLPVERALGLLLAGSGLAYRVVDEHTVAVQQESERFTKHISSKSTASSADSESGAQSSAPSGGTFSSLSQVATTSATDDSHRAPAKEELEEIVVTGTHIRGVKRVSAPSMTIAREEMERAGFTTVEEVFSALPQNFGGISFAATYALEGTSSLAQSNTDRAVGVDLRGLGAQSTLTLLNGHRRAGSLDGRVVDISAIPLSVIDRVEVVTGGRSAIYGSDAVAGVVNLVTRHDFQGAQTQASYGWTDSGGGEAQVSQIFGLHSDHGGFVAAYDYSRQSTLDLVDTGLFVSPIPSNGQTILRRDIQPRGTRHSGYLAGTIDIGDRVHISGDALYTSREFDQASIWLFNEVSNPSHDFGSNSSDQFSFALSSQIDLTSAWGLNISVTDSGVKNSFDSDAFYDLGFFSVSLPFNQDSDSGISTLSSVFEGPLPSIAGIVPRAAFGAERRWEDFKRTRTSAPTIDNDRTVNSAFVELLLPINQVEVSLAGRYDKYSDFGSTVNPQFGVSWAINRDLTIRGAYSEAFRAPALVELGTTADVTLSELSDPLSGGVTPVLFRTGDNSDLEPEEAKTWSFGMDFAPQSLGWLRSSVSIFSVEYKKRIDTPAISTTDQQSVLEHQERYPGLIDLNPSAAEIAELLAAGRFFNNTATPFDPASQDVLTVFPTVVIFDGRTQNISVERVRGLDLSLDTTTDSSYGALTLGLNATYTLKHDRNITATSPTFSLLNEVGKPIRFRARANAGVSRGPFGINAYLNYANSYSNPFSTPASKMPSWTTLDLSLTFSGATLETTPALQGFNATVAIDNVFDKDPPTFLESGNGLRYDSTNASAVGRFLSLRISKNW